MEGPSDAVSHAKVGEVPKGCSMAVSMRPTRLDLLGSWAARRTCRLSDGDAAGCEGAQPSEQLQQCGLPGTAAPIDQAQLPGRHPEADAPQEGLLSACEQGMTTFQGRASNFVLCDGAAASFGDVGSATAPDT